MATITLNPAVTYQTFRGWEATATDIYVDDAAQAATDAPYLYDQAVNDLGITRLRLEAVKVSGQNHFDLAAIDRVMNDVAIPMRNLLLARGETLWINMCVVGNQFAVPSLNTAGYASATVEMYQHLQATFGLLPNSWEVALEPDNFSWGGAFNVGACMIAAGDALVAAGFGANIHMVTPSDAFMDDAVRDFNTIVAMARALNYWRTLCWHDYSFSAANWLPYFSQLYGLSQGTTPKLETAMLEHIAATHSELYDLLTVANVSVFQQYALEYPQADEGSQYYYINTAGVGASNRVLLSAYAKFLRQYMKYIRPGAVRCDATSDSGSVKAAAFRNSTGLYAVVCTTTGALTFGVAGLPAGTYGLKYLYGSGAASYNLDFPDQQINAGQQVTATVTGAAVLTVYGKTLQTQQTGSAALRASARLTETHTQGATGTLGSSSLTSAARLAGTSLVKQRAIPILTLVSGTWTDQSGSSANLYMPLDAVDAFYDQSEANPVGSGLTVSFGALLPPVAGAQTLDIRLSKDLTGGIVDFTVNLRTSTGVLIQTFDKTTDPGLGNVSATDTLVSLSVTKSIPDYTSVELEVLCNQIG